MITLYVKTGCPYCHKVIEAFHEHNIQFEEKNIADEAAHAELIEKGGKQQVPFMVDDTTMMYESDDIIAYALGMSAQSSGEKAAGETCDSGVCGI